jgi:hypothetical protein
MMGDGLGGGDNRMACPRGALLISRITPTLRRLQITAKAIFNQSFILASP